MTKILSLLLVLVICFASILTGCSQSTARALTPEEQSLVQSGNNFGFKLFREIVNHEQDKNILTSPFSVDMALGMTLNGANGDTRQAMEKTLELSGLTEEAINKSYKSLIELLKGLDPDVKLQLANSIWYEQGESFEKEFLGLAPKYFDTEVSKLDFSDPKALDVINGWIKENTNGKIDKIIDGIDPAAVMFLINTLYFKAFWSYPFNREYTQDDSFTLPDGSQKACQMMDQQEEFQYFYNSNFQAIDIPYGDGDYSMTIFLPHGGKDIASLISEFNEANWTAWSNSFSKQEVFLQLPKFTLEYELKLNDVLKALGMGLALDPAMADFTRMSKSGGIWIDEVTHKTFIEVNEEGTVAVAASAAMVTSSYSTLSMRVDRPFVFVIREHLSGTILFMGKIVDPTL